MENSKYITVVMYYNIMYLYKAVCRIISQGGRGKSNKIYFVNFNLKISIIKCLYNGYYCSHPKLAGGAGQLAPPPTCGIVYLTESIVIQGTYNNTHVSLTIIGATERCESYFNRINLGKLDTCFCRNAEEMSILVKCIHFCTRAHRDIAII